MLQTYGTVSGYFEGRSYSLPISKRCRSLGKEHRLRPILFPSWPMTRFGGALSSEPNSQLLVDSRLVFDSIPVNLRHFLILQEMKMQLLCF